MTENKTNDTIDFMFLTTLLLAEITRYKGGKKGWSLTNPTIERNARHRFAEQVGFNPKSKAEKFIAEIRAIYKINNMEDRFLKTLKSFGLDEKLFPVIFERQF